MVPTLNYVECHVYVAGHAIEGEFTKFNNNARPRGTVDVR